MKTTSKAPKPNRPGWRFLRNGERARKEDRYQPSKVNPIFWKGIDKNHLDAPLSIADIGVPASTPEVLYGGTQYCGYIRRIRKAKKAK